MELIERLAKHMVPHGYVARELDGVPATWVRRRWLTNRALVVVELPDGADPADFIKREKYVLGKKIGYVPLFWAVYMQVVLVGESDADLYATVDRIDNQRCIVQSLHVASPSSRSVRSVRTWGQFLSGSFHDAIEAALAEWSSTA